ncbi:hypothetical protein GCM10011351_00350 [Paraliobacillus quinghaiensis]|uniref:VanZ-like domain-containing protein n=1 Tax=Paraliobacillus quinghaiensis TaxID=470815 RepID=A0A917WPB5_9BACI|nr:VanZ family protein [Paraliobacillus quinghaiensis]GGM18528.1 hypothetical protein GCM10011351_00350 [Paraliobacillus quinghaiensis]
MKSLYNKEVTINIVFFSYIFVLFIISFWGTSTFSPRNLFDYSGANFTPLSTISTYILNFHHYNFDTWFYNTIGNVLMFIPFGVLLPVNFKFYKRLPQIIIATIILSSSIELTQYLTNLGIFDIDTILLNLIGSLIGFMAVKNKNN